MVIFKNMIQNTVDIRFYSNGLKQRVKFQSDNFPTLMFQTSDDRYMEKYWSWDSEEERHEINITKDKSEMLLPDDSFWRLLAPQGCDKLLIRNCISALNFNKQSYTLTNDVKSQITELIETSRPIWQNNEYEPIPTPTPTPKAEEITDLLPFNRIEKYGVVLKRLTHDKIELVRKWRNDPKISQYMEYRDEISREMQENWFRKIDNIHNLYYLIEIKGNDIGLINIKNIENKHGEAGIFIWDDKYLNSDVSYRAHLVLFDVFFNDMKMDYILSHILKSNKRARRFADFLGSKLADIQENVENQLSILSKHDYLFNNNRIRYIKHFNNNNE